MGITQSGVKLFSYYIDVTMNIVNTIVYWTMISKKLLKKSYCAVSSPLTANKTDLQATVES